MVNVGIVRDHLTLHNRTTNKLPLLDGRGRRRRADGRRPRPRTLDNANPVMPSLRRGRWRPLSLSLSLSLDNPCDHPLLRRATGWLTLVLPLTLTVVQTVADLDTVNLPLARRQRRRRPGPDHLTIPDRTGRPRAVSWPLNSLNLALAQNKSASLAASVILKVAGQRVTV